MIVEPMVSRPRFEDYREHFKKYLIMERENGIIQVRMHYEGGEVKWNMALHNALAQAWHVIGNDPENEVMIFTSTGSNWIVEVHEDMHEREEQGKIGYDEQMYDSSKLVENLIFDLDIPTIAAVNGPGLHTEIALMCDLTLCADHAVFNDGHFLAGWVPGDGQLLAFQGLIGLKRASYYMYTDKTIDAQTALEWGMVNEVLPLEKLLPRAWEIAEYIMQRPRPIRRLTSLLLKRPWQRLVMDDFRMHMAYEFYGQKEVNGWHDMGPITAALKEKRK